MQINKITDDYSVAPQLLASDMADVAAAGFTTVICNRPDTENPVEQQIAAMKAAAEAAGLVFVANPVTHPTINPETIGAQSAAIENSAGPTLGYCASGTRCSILWSLGRVGKDSADDILAATQNAGYDLSGLRPNLGG